jgi:hypothetical protein
MSETSPEDRPQGSADPGAPVDYLEDRGPARFQVGRKGALVGAAAAGLLAVAGAGAWAVAQLMGGGEAPAAAVPDDALAYVSLDLDPSAGQKIEALRTLRKFPALREHLGAGSGDDLRHWLYQGLTADVSCDDLDFDKDVSPWLGDRVALAVLPGADGPAPVGLVQVTDQDAATAGIAKISACADEPAPGTAFSGDYLVLADTDAAARQAAADAEAGALADDGSFRRWVDEAGGAGIVTAYLSADAPDAFLEAGGAADAPPFSGGPAGMRKALADFDGAALAVRFDGGAVEVETAASKVGSIPADAVATGDGGLSELPASTALGVGVAVGDGFAKALLDAATADNPRAADMLEQWASSAGLSLPEDLQTLLGDGVSLAVDSSIDVKGFMDPRAPDPSTIPAGLRISGDPARIRAVLDKLLAALGPAASDVVVAEGDHAVAVGVDRRYAATLAGDGDLGDQNGFKSALPELADSSGALYVGFDTGDWLTSLLDEDPDAAEAKANAEPLDSLGVSGRVEGDVLHGLLRLTTD